jgi:hypothetical protein
MARRWRVCLLMICLPSLLLLGLWGYDHALTVWWIRATNLEVEFIVISAESGQPIPAARIEVQSDCSWYGEGFEGERAFEVSTDTAGAACKQCRNNVCSGIRSGLCITDTYNVSLPRWRLRVLALGYEPSAYVNLVEEYNGKVQHEGPERDRLVVRISLQKAAAKLNRNRRQSNN